MYIKEQKERELPPLVSGTANLVLVLFPTLRKTNSEKQSPDWPSEVPHANSGLASENIQPAGMLMSEHAVPLPDCASQDSPRILQEERQVTYHTYSQVFSLAAKLLGQGVCMHWHGVGNLWQPHSIKSVLPLQGLLRSDLSGGLTSLTGWLPGEKMSIFLVCYSVILECSFSSFLASKRTKLFFSASLSI